MHRAVFMKRNVGVVIDCLTMNIYSSFAGDQDSEWKHMVPILDVDKTANLLSIGAVVTNQLFRDQFDP